MAGRKPEFRLKAGLPDVSSRLTEVGAGWINDNGSISIVLNPFTVLDARTKITLILYPEDEK